MATLSQPGYGRQYDKTHAVTVTATADIAEHRFVSYNGAHTPAEPASGADDCQGVSETRAAAGEALSVVTGYSYLVEAGAAIALFDYVKPAADGSGRAAVGTVDDHCGRALSMSGGAGYVIEVQIVQHVKPAATP
jgi:hypothetical protein